MPALPVLSAIWLAFHAVAAQAPAEPALIVYAQMADYPADALAAKAEGDVAIVLHIAPEGSLRCTVSDKTAPPTLRRPSCLLVAQRWPFGPNLDAKGVAQPTDVNLTVRWKIADTSIEPSADFGGATPISPGSWFTNDDYPWEALRYNRQGKVRVTFDVTAQGRFANCVVVVPTKSRLLSNAACPIAMKRALLLPAVGPDGLPRATRGFITINWVLPKN